MDDLMKQTVYETLSEVFETMYFTFLEPLFETPSKEELAAGREYFEAAISYQGQERKGVFRFYLPKRLARSIALNFLGVDEGDLSEAQVADTVRETANMSVGSLLGKVDPDGTCRLGLPEAREINDFSPEALLPKPGLFIFNTEFGPLWVVHEE